MRVPQLYQNIITFNNTVTKRVTCAVILEAVLLAVHMTCLDNCQLWAKVWIKYRQKLIAFHKKQTDKDKR
jgi:hypothetical protein